MRFFAHDGKVLSGPSTVSELIASPGFDGDTLVCPVGSADTNDWKPALAYPPFRQALLAPAPKPVPVPVPPPAPRPAPTSPCPKCSHDNPEGARYCNACAARMDGTIETPPPRYEPEPPASKPEPPDLTPAFDAPVSEPAASVESAYVSEPPPVVEDAPSPASARPESSAWRKTLIAAFIGATAASGALGWWLLGPSRRPAPAAARPVPSAPKPSPAAATPLALPPTPAPAPMVKPAAAPPAAPKMEEKPAARPRRAAKPRRVPKPRAEAAPALKTVKLPGWTPPKEGAAESPAAKSAAGPGFLLPGIPRPVSKSAVAAPQEAAPAAPLAGASAEAEDGVARQVREQFDFCAQLLTQGAYADHFDTCLCSDARAAAPYKGIRGVYAAETQKLAFKKKLETKAEVRSVAIEDNTATVKAWWKNTATGAARESAERWRLEDGLWCRAP